MGELLVQGVDLSAGEIQAALRASVNAVFEDVIDDMRTGGMTAIYEAIASACSMLATAAAEHPDADLRVICLSDGQNNCDAYLESMRACLRRQLAQQDS